MTVKVMTAGGMDQEAIASVIGVTRKTLGRHFRKELTYGAAELNGLVVQSIYQMAIKGKNVAAAIWLTKTRMRWSEKIEVEGDLGFGQLVALMEARRVKSEGGS